MTLGHEIVLAVIRGELPLSALEDAGVRFALESQGSGKADRQIKVNAAIAIIVKPSPSDIARGLLAYKHEPEQFQTWATFVLGASELIDLEGLDQWPEGDEILSGLWDASFEGYIKPETERVAAALVEP